MKCPFLTSNSLFIIHHLNSKRRYREIDVLRTTVNMKKIKRRDGEKPIKTDRPTKFSETGPFPGSNPDTDKTPLITIQKAIHLKTSVKTTKDPRVCRRANGKDLQIGHLSSDTYDSETLPNILKDVILIRRISSLNVSLLSHR